jgi:hypothetical protein
MAYAVLIAVGGRLAREGRLDASALEAAAGRFLVPGEAGEVDELTVPVLERPPMTSLRAAPA